MSRPEGGAVPARRSSKSRVLDRETLWRLPALLSTVAVLVLPCWPVLPGSPRGSFVRETLAAGLAVGTCGMLLGLGLGLWVAARTRTRRALMAAVWSVLVAVAWWWVVYGPLLEGEVSW